MTSGVLVIGSLNYDMIYNVVDLPRPHETVAATAFDTAPGGKGSNQAVACAVTSAAPVTMLGCVGRDMYAERCVGYLEANRVDVTQLQVQEGVPTGTACVLVDKAGDNLIVVSAGANGKLTPHHIERADDLFAKHSVALLQLEVPLETVRRSLEVARKHGAMTILNPAPYVSGVEAFMPLADVFTPNQTEASSLSGVEVTDEASAREAGDRIRAMGAGTVIITLGSQGSLVVEESGAVMVPSYAVEQVVDTTGAGDVYNGALAGALSEGAGMVEAATLASAAASMSVMRPTASNCAPTREALAAFMDGAE